MRLWTLSALLLVVGGAGLVRAQSGERLMHLRVTGTLVPPEAAQREDLFTVPIVVQETPLLLRVGQVEELTTSERAQVREALVLRQVRFSGPAALLARLQQPERRGRVLTIEGMLEPTARLFLVTAVKEVPNAPSPRGK
jgi:hypothetical protein